MYTTSDLKKGLIIDFDGGPCIVDSVSMSTPSARGANCIFKVRLRNLKSKQKLDKSFRSGETFGVPDFERRPIQFLYADNTGHHFMDTESYDQFALQKEDIDWEMNFLVEELEGVKALTYNEQVIAIELPPTVTLEITETPPAVRGNSATARTKNATLETGHVIQVPEHISQGENVNVDTRSGDFLGRAGK